MSTAKGNTLCQGQFAGPVDRVGLPAHVLLPGVRTGFAAAASFLLSAKCPANLSPGGADIDIRNPAIGTGDREELSEIYRRLDEMDTRDIETVSHRPKQDLFHWPLAGMVVLSLCYHLFMTGLRSRSKSVSI